MTDEPTRTEPADFGGGESTGVQDLLGGDEPDTDESDMPTEPRRLEEVMSDNDTDTRHTVSESADKITVTTNTKRGSGTRDEDKIRVKVKGDDPDEVVDKLNQTLLNLHNETAAELRNNQPEQ